MLQKQKYTTFEITAGLQNEGITDKYEILIEDNGKINIRKKLAFKEGNFGNPRNKKG